MPLAIVVSPPTSLPQRGSAGQLGLPSDAARALGPARHVRPGTASEVVDGRVSAASSGPGGLGLLLGARGELGGVAIDLALRLRVMGAPGESGSGVSTTAAPAALQATKPRDLPFDATFTDIASRSALPEASSAPARAQAARAIATYQRTGRSGGGPAVSLRA